MKLTTTHLVLLRQADTEGKATATTEHEKQSIAELQVAGYLDHGARITRLGRGALKGQGKGL